MHEHALDTMIYAWRVMKEKEENKMEGIFLGKVDQTAFDPRCISLSFGTKHLDQHVEVRKELDYDCDYMLVKANDVIVNNDELLKLRDEVKRLTDECDDWKVRYSKVNNELFQKGLAYGTLEEAYKNEKIAGEILLKDRDALKERVDKLEEELTEIKTARTLREAYITGVEKGCESLREERDRWKRRWNSVVTDIAKSLEANGIEFTLKEVHGNGNWDVVIDIPELNEAKAKVADLEKKLAAAKSNETYWRDRKEEEEDYHHYWQHTFNRAVTQAEQKGVYIGVSGNDEECNAGVVIVDNGKANELESQVVQMEDANQKLRKRISAADERIEGLESQRGIQGDHWKRNYETLTEYWNNTYKEIVAAGKEVGVKIKIIGRKPDGNTGTILMTNEKALELALHLNNMKQKHDKKWSAMLQALKEKGVEVIYMCEEDGKPIVDVKIPEIDILKKELEALKSRTLDNVEIRLSYGDIMWTYCDGFVHVSSGISGMISADEISTGTIPTCKSCAHYMHNPSRFAHDWCYKPVLKEGGAGYIHKLSKEEAEGPACSDYKARKE